MKITSFCLLLPCTALIVILNAPESYAKSLMPAEQSRRQHLVMLTKIKKDERDAAFLGRRQGALLVGGNTLQEEQDEVFEGSAHSLSLGKDEGSSSQHHQPGSLASPAAALATAISQSTISSFSSSSAVVTTESVDSMTPPPSYTPISTSVDVKSGVPLYIPVVDPSAQSGSVEVAYLGPGNAGATLYEVISKASDRTITATLRQDATDAKLLGGVRTATVNGIATQVWAAASCGFKDGLDKGTNAAAGYCVYFEVVNGVSTTFSTVVTQITAMTTIYPTPSAVQKSIAHTASGVAEKDMNAIPSAAAPVSSPVLVWTMLVAVSAALFGSVLVLIA
ncbi:hypothetical protein FA10DRAFT_264240 [Acaromyces ingoldii]|uniref:Uncharacterized protein n=1 Tax=Acaromyces ingoldii TaxID=215250 RepID=A0A316YVN0_9BASI|nr:hypothetical protein FA10DRAFT_264240 [Acaromyces ingoldii]PWN93610.1 hypothetical protein FA10DRAFT_264240 [Acaromyces ingoldii]